MVEGVVASVVAVASVVVSVLAVQLVRVRAARMINVVFFIFGFSFEFVGFRLSL